ncbi:outer membrane protein assembly factor BamA [Pseudooceanicola sp. CBS1P-1]|uniref:Outer membrane protein assembly factor BamA n=1 Tax=Pseudooceanicola albus TaxID=2692189 RepID=A0A6L7FYZ3_9RHOB|nr:MULTISPECIES: outer membrane protein assembly factor BamA [Pseudooceanicola]MBT9383181.1 outer membrane protein assembly factor BamA [Pseudooceanicola endophyticus]MXN16496.1 outer membrane protein assembly factor BamA [Pseudooceanicola albus]
MPKNHAAGTASAPVRRRLYSAPLAAALFMMVSGVSLSVPQMAAAQSYSFNAVSVEGNTRIPTGTILSYAGIAKGANVSAAELNDAYQRIVASGLFETVQLTPQGGTLKIQVAEYPTINKIDFEGNARLKDDDLAQLVKSKVRQVYSPSQAEADAALISQSYAAQGRLAAKVTPRIIRRSDNRVDLVFEIFEGGVTEVQRISFVGNRDYSDRRLRQVLQTKQVNILHALFKNDTFVTDRVEFDKQALTDFYHSRGYVDFRITGVNAELSPERDGYVVTYNIQEGQQFKLGKVSTVSNYPGVDAKDYQDALKVKPGMVYSPSIIDNSVTRLERLAVRQGRDFLRVDPKITRNDRDQTLDVTFELNKGKPMFVERIDIQGNTTTLDRVIRNQFHTVEGDPFNPRAIREAAERIRALGFFKTADVNARKGTADDQVIVDVKVEEQPTGSLSFGGTYSTTDGFGLAVSLSENNFMGRGQTVGLTLSGASSDQVYGARFVEPNLLGRDVKLSLGANYEATDSDYADYDTEVTSFTAGLTFPAGELSTYTLRYSAQLSDVTLNDTTVGSLITAEAAKDPQLASAIGYGYSYDTRTNGLNPNAGMLFEFNQDFAGLGGDEQYIKTTAKAIAQTKLMNEELTLRATFRAGMINSLGDSHTLVTDRYRIGNSIMRGFQPDGIGPRQRDSDGTYDDMLGGTTYAVASFDAEFPLGLPEELGITGGTFLDIGSAWGLDQSASDVLYEDGPIRVAAGVSIFWNTPIGPLRFNFSKALKKEKYDQTQTFDLSIRTDF